MGNFLSVSSAKQVNTTLSIVCHMNSDQRVSTNAGYQPICPRGSSYSRGLLGEGRSLGSQAQKGGLIVNKKIPSLRRWCLHQECSKAHNQIQGLTKCRIQGNSCLGIHLQNKAGALGS